MDLDQVREWTCNSTEACTIHLQGKEGKHEFQPTFTYPIYGEEELIYGYKDLKITVKFDSSILLPLAQVDYSEKRPESDAKAVLNELLKWMPFDTCTDEAEWEKRRREESFSIPGEQVSTIAGSNGDYQVYRCNIKECQGLLERFQLFVLFFIEAGSYIDRDDESWEIYLVYKDNSEFVGFCTVYPYFYFTNCKEHDQITEIPYRKRISQFVILPPYQHNKVGQGFYKMLVERFLAEGRVGQITVEDPSEAFDVLRDRCDLEILAKAGMLDDSKFALPLDKEWLESQLKKYKMAERQFIRCVEMGLLKKLDDLPTKQYRLWVKKRLYLRNREGLADKEDADVKQLLEATFQEVVAEYKKNMESVDFGKSIGKKRKASAIDM